MVVRSNRSGDFGADFAEIEESGHDCATLVIAIAILIAVFVLIHHRAVHPIGSQAILSRGWMALDLLAFRKSVGSGKNRAQRPLNYGRDTGDR